MQQFPYGLIPLMPQLPLKFASGECPFGRGKQMYCYEPIEKRKFGSVHDSPTSEGSPMTTTFAFPLFPISFPIVVFASTFGANHTMLFSQGFEMSLASLLIGKMSLEFYEIHGVAILF